MRDGGFIKELSSQKEVKKKKKERNRLHGDPILCEV